MTQPLWYLRSKARIVGPFPSPQIREFLISGEITPEWEVSLNESDWLTIAECGQFDEVGAHDPDAVQTDASEWREERLRARQRWLGHLDPVSTALGHDPGQDGLLRQSIAMDHDGTELLLCATRSRPAPFLPVLIGLLVLLLIGLAVWWGQGDPPFRTGFGASPQCAQPAAEGVNWSGCDKRGASLPGLRARNARMAGTRLDDAQLTGADLAYGVFSGASLRNTRLGGSALVGAEMTGADFSGADLAGADLRYTVLKDAVLAGTRLDGVRLGKATWVDGRVCAEESVGACR